MNLVMGPSEAKTKQQRLRKKCTHCNLVHNKHNDSPHGCHNTKIETAQTLASKINLPKTLKKLDSVDLPSSDSSQSEQGEIFMPDESMSEGNASDAYDPKADQDDEETSDEEKINKANSISNLRDEEYMKGATSSDSFSDAESYE